MALWDLAGKLLGKSVATLLGGSFLATTSSFIRIARRAISPIPSPGATAPPNSNPTPHGFSAFKVDIHSALGLSMQEYVPSLSPGDIRKVRRSYELAREHLGDDIDIIVHCHCELDTSSAIAVAQVVEPIKPLYYEDPLQPGFFPKTGWRCAAPRALPIMTGENIELPEQALPLPADAGGRLPAARHRQFRRHHTGTKLIADLAALYRTPITLHNVSGLLLNMASQQLAASIFDCPRIECTRGATKLAWASTNPLQISGGRMKISTAPGLGVELDQDYLKAHRFAGEPWWN